MRAKTFVTSLTTVLIVAAVASLWAVASPTGASCAAAFSAEQVTVVASDSSDFVAQVNQLRASKGLGALTVDSNLTAVAQQWAQHLGELGGIAHRGDLSDGITIDWRLLGENVGHAPSVSEMMTGFINSPTHYENLVNGSFTRIGVGTVRTPDGTMFTAHEFASVRSAAPAPAPAPVSAPAPAPVPAPAAPKVVPASSAPTVTAAAPAPSTTVTTAAPVAPATVTVEHTARAAATHAAPVAKTHTGC